MLDGVSLDQMRTFIAAAEEGSFSAAGRKLKRAQSVVSQTLANLEAQLGVSLFDRSERYPKLTETGEALLIDARSVVENMDAFKARAKSLHEGLEPELSVAIDVMYPMCLLTKAAGYSRDNFLHTPLRLYVEVLGGVAQLVLDGSCRLGIIGSLPLVPEGLVAEPLGRIAFATVVNPKHPLAAIHGMISEEELARHVQLILTDKTSLSSGQNYAVLSPLIWRLADLSSKRAFLKAGFGWGHMPLHMVEKDIQEGTLVNIQLLSIPASEMFMNMHLVYRKDEPPGPAGKAFISQLMLRRH
jgi:DNA-binding transcriptional LysR family regulator